MKWATENYYETSLYNRSSIEMSNLNENCIQVQLLINWNIKTGFWSETYWNFGRKMLHFNKSLIFFSTSLSIEVPLWNFLNRTSHRLLVTEIVILNHSKINYSVQTLECFQIQIEWMSGEHWFCVWLWMWMRTSILLSLLFHFN